VIDLWKLSFTLGSLEKHRYWVAVSDPAHLPPPRHNSRLEVHLRQGERNGYGWRNQRVQPRQPVLFRPLDPEPRRPAAGDTHTWD